MGCKMNKPLSLPESDLRLIIELIKERNRLRALANEYAEKEMHYRKLMIETRRKVADLSNENIAEKFGLKKDSVFRIGHCKACPEDIKAIDPDFYRETVDQNEKTSLAF